MTPKTILISGISQGIGKALAHFYLSLGYKVVGIGRKSCPELTALKGFSFKKMDLLELDKLAPLATQLAEEFEVDVFIHNAMWTAPHKLYLRVSAEELLNAHTLASIAPLIIIQKITSGMRKRGFGRLIFLGSAVQLTGSRGQLSYLTAKSAVDGLVKTLALELAKSKITTNQLLLGPVQTEKFEQNVSPENQEKIKQASPSGELLSYEQLAQTIAFLISPAAQAINGVALPIDHAIHLSGGAL